MNTGLGASAGLPGLSAPERELEAIAGSLAEAFVGTFTPETVQRYVQESYTALAERARISAHLPVLTERFARERLTALAQAEGALPRTVPEVLFVCVQNAGRSQMAAALLAHHAYGRVHVRSAGSMPADQVDPSAIAALAEVGVDVQKAFPKPLTDEVVRAADVVITMGCGDACPVYPGKRYEDWAVPDPAGTSVQDARRVRDEIDRRVTALLAELVG